ncbi:MAG: hypothetical protein ACYCPH_02650 [Minisyncoccota bacterium]
MDPELKRTLDEIHALAKENHHMLRAIRRDQWLGLIGKVIVWIIVLLLPLYLYQQYLQPIVSKFSGTAGATVPSGLFGLPTTAEFQKLINSFKAGSSTL